MHLFCPKKTLVGIFCDLFLLFCLFVCLFFVVVVLLYIMVSYLDMCLVKLPGTYLL